MPSSFFSFTSSAIFSISRALFTWYGSSVTTIASRPLLVDSRSRPCARMRTRPRPVRYAGMDAGDAVDDARGREVRARDVLASARRRRSRDRRSARWCASIDFVEVVRRDVGRHAHRDAGRAVDQQVGHPGRHDRRARVPSRRSWAGSRRFPCRCRPSARAPGATCAPRCNAWPPAESPSTEPKLPCPSTSM